MTHQFRGKVEEFFGRVIKIDEERIAELEKKYEEHLDADHVVLLIGDDYGAHFLIKAYPQLKNTSEFKRFKEFVKRSKALKKKLGKLYFELIEENLKKIICDYAHYLTFPYSDKHYSEEFQYMLWMRDTIEASLAELRQKKPIKEYLAQIIVLDQQLKERTQREKLIQSWNFDEDYFPKSFWWRHLHDKN